MSFSQHLTDNQLAAIGRVAVESAWLEAAVERYISRLTRLSKRNTAALLKGRMMSFKLETLDMLGQGATKDPARRREFAELMKHIKAANDDRNDVIHGLWGMGSPKSSIEGLTGFLFPYEAEAQRRTRKGNLRTMKASEIDRAANAVTESTWKLISFGANNWLQYFTPSERRRELIVQQLLHQLEQSDARQSRTPSPRSR